MHQLQRPWVRSQHPSAQWNLRGGRWSRVEYSTNEKNSPNFLPVCEVIGATQRWIMRECNDIFVLRCKSDQCVRREHGISFISTFLRTVTHYFCEAKNWAMLLTLVSHLSPDESDSSLPLAPLVLFSLNSVFLRRHKNENSQWYLR